METLLLRSWIEICPRVRERKELQLKYWEVEKTVVAVTTSPLSRARSGCSILRGPTWVELRAVRVAQLKKKKKKNNRDEKKEEEEKKISNRGRTSCPFSFFLVVDHLMKEIVPQTLIRPGTLAVFVPCVCVSTTFVPPTPGLSCCNITHPAVAAGLLPSDLPVATIVDSQHCINCRLRIKGRRAAVRTRLRTDTLDEPANHSEGPRRREKKKK